MRALTDAAPCLPSTAFARELINPAAITPQPAGRDG